MSFDRANQIKTKEELARLLDELSAELVSAPDEWENPDLKLFLSAMAAWIRAIDMYAKNTGDSDAINPSWSTFAKILCAAKIYE